MSLTTESAGAVVAPVVTDKGEVCLLVVTGTVCAGKKVAPGSIVYASKAEAATLLNGGKAVAHVEEPKKKPGPKPKAKARAKPKDE